MDWGIFASKNPSFSSSKFYPIREQIATQRAIERADRNPIKQGVLAVQKESRESRESRGKSVTIPANGE
jgi:hypothetical protein